MWQFLSRLFGRKRWNHFRSVPNMAWWDEITEEWGPSKANKEDGSWPPTTWKTT